MFTVVSSQRSYLRGECVLNTLGERIAHWREQRGLTQKDIAEAIGVSPQQVSGYERNYRMPPSDTLGKLAETLQVSADYLLCRTDDPTLNLKNDKPTPQEQLAEMGVEVWARGHALTQEDVDFIKAYLETKEQQRKGGIKRK